MTIRLAHAGDGPALCAMAERFLASTIYKHVLVSNPAQILELVGTLLAQGAIFVAESPEDGEPVGMLAVAVVPNYIDGKLTGSELAFWIDEAHRGGSTAVRLKDEAETWAAEMGAVRMAMVAPHGSRIGAIYERWGYAAVETTYQKELTGYARLL